MAAQAANPALVSVVIRGSSVYDAPELYPVYQAQLGREVTLEGARAIAAALVARYEADGYTRPQLKIDDALLAVGVLRIDVLEPRIAAVRVSGDPGPHLARLESLGSQLRADGPIRRAGLESTLRRMRALPGLSLQASTASDAASANLYTLELDTQFEPTTGSIRLNNRGTDEAGPHFVVGQLMLNGLLGGDTNIGTLFSAATDYDEYHGLGLVANVGIGPAGGRLSWTGFRSRSDPREPSVDRDDVYLRDRVAFGFSRPLSGAERVTATLRAGVDLDDLEITRSGERLRDERLRLLSVGTSWRWRHDTVQYAGSVELVKGLDAFGAGLTAIDLATDPRRADFALTRATFTRLARLGDYWSVRIDALSQQSAYTLPYGERFQIGGERLGRGFEVAEIVGDQGIGAKLEGRRRLPGAMPLLGGLSIYGFYDVGAAWKQDVPGRESAATAGVGFGSQGERVSTSLELAKPLTHVDVEGRDDLTLFVEVAVAL